MSRRPHIETRQAVRAGNNGQLEVFIDSLYHGEITKTQRVDIDLSCDAVTRALTALGWTPPAPKVDVRALDLEKEFTRIGDMSEAGRAPMIWHIENDKINVAGVLNAGQFMALAVLSGSLKE